MKTYQHFGVMIDCSRNGVMNIPTVKNLINYLQKMGYNTLELYTEDTYEVLNEPYFGYLRGRYSFAELKELDEYAKTHGIELIPCIQTLAHFTSTVKLPQYNDIVDTADIFMIDEERTYELIDRMFQSLSQTFTSRHVNIGMDEAHMVGLGKHLDKYGYEPQFQLLLRHLTRVAGIAKKYGFECHMWSDMFFRLINHGNYYGDNLHVPKSICEKLPENVNLTYWDYYHNDVAVYDDMIRAHQSFHKPLWFAGGAWTWCGFAPLTDHTRITMKPAMESIIKHDIQNVFFTLWGDNGKECSFFTMLAELYAIRRYADGEFDDEKINEEFFNQFGLKREDFSLLSLPNYTDIAHTDGLTVENPTKSLLYADCFMGIFDEVLSRKKPIAYKEYAAILREAALRTKEFDYLFYNLANLCDVLEIKYDLGVQTRNAYRQKDLTKLTTLIATYEELSRRLQIFYQSFKAQWFRENKPIGFEIHEARLGGLMLRIRSCTERLVDYINGKISRIEDLEEAILPYLSDDRIYLNEYHKIISTSNL